MTIALPLQAIVEGAMTVNGAPAEGSVVAERTDGAGIPNPNGYYFDPFREAKADASGSFRLDGLPPGEYTLSTSAVTGTAETTFFRHESVRVQVEAGTTTQVSLNVTGSASIQGTFSFPTKYRRGRVHLLEGDFTAQLSGANPEDYRRAMRASTERMRESGAYSFDHLDPGTYTLIGLCYNNRELEGTGEETDRPQVGKLVHLRDRDHLTIDLIFDTP